MVTFTVPVVTFHLTAASDVQTKSGRGKKGNRDTNPLKIYNAIILGNQCIFKFKEIPLQFV